MKVRGKFACPRDAGFSVVELALSLAVLLIITTVAVPVVVRSLQTYQLNSSASQLAGMLKFTKFDAIRQNTPVSCQIQQQPDGSWLVWVDSNGDGLPNGAEPQMYVNGSFTLLPAVSVPDPSPIQNALGAFGKTLAWTVVSGANGAFTYDQRGVSVTISGGTVSGLNQIYVLYLGSTTNPDTGYRAILRLPSGAVQVWTSSSAGNWQRVS